MRGTPEAPLVIRWDSAERAQEEREAARAREVDRATEESLARYTEYLFFATLVLAGGTLALWWATRRLAIDAANGAAEQAKLTRDALELSRREFVTTNRPRLTVRQIARRTTADDDVIEFLVVNVGATPARNVSGHAVVVFTGKGRPLPSRPFEESAAFFQGIEVQPGEMVPVTWSEEESGHFTLAMADQWRKESDVHLVAQLDYQDDIGVWRHVGLCRRLDRDLDRFVPVDDPILEFAD